VHGIGIEGSAAGEDVHDRSGHRIYGEGVVVSGIGEPRV